MDELDQLHELEEVLKANFIEFKVEDITYRVKKPSLRETSDLNYARMKKYNEMLADNDYKFEAQLKETYKAKGIDLNKMDIRLIELQRKENDLLSILAKKHIQSEIEQLKEEIVHLRTQKNELLSEKNELLFYKR